MQKIRSWIIGAFFIGFFALTVSCEKKQLVETESCDSPGNVSHPRSEAFQQILADYTDKGLPGITLLIRDSSGVWTGSAGMADIEEGVPMDVCHISKVASITKPFMAALTLKLEKEAVLTLSDPVQKHVDEEKLEGIANAKKATIRQLLNHTSGVYDIVSDDDFYLAVLNQPKKEWDQEDLLEYVEDEPAYFARGTDVKYSNTNFLLLSMVIEGATGRSHFELLKEKIIDPLGLENTVYHPQQSLPGKTAQGYFDLYNNGQIVDVSNYNTGNGNGYNGIYSTVEDLQVFIEALLRDKTLLVNKQLAKMKDFNRAETYREIGVGIMKDFQGHPAETYGLGHGGSDLAYSGEMYYFPEEDYTMVTLVNYGTNGESELGTVYEQYRSDVVEKLME